MKYFISAGEASGDLHASQLILELKKKDKSAQFVFLGGEKMKEAAGVDPLIDIGAMSIMGFGQVVRRLPKILGQIELAKKTIAEQCPDALILVDYPSFNLKLAAYAHKIGVKVFWYISPKVWVWKEHRVKAMKKYIDRLYCILPFEVEYFKKRHGWDVAYVGNPSVEEVENKKKNIRNLHLKEFLRLNGIPEGKPILALLPGSRVSEIQSNLPIMVEVAGRMKDYQPVIAAVAGLPKSLYESYSNDIPLVVDKTFELLNFSEAALVTSGTATLETALLRVPQVMLYRHSGSKTIYTLFRRLLKVDYFSLPNLITGKETIKEHVMHFCTSDAVEKSLLEIIPGGKNHDLQQRDYDKMSEILGVSNPSVKVADDIYRTLTDKE